VGDDDWSDKGSPERRRTPRSLLVFRSDATFPALPESRTDARLWCEEAFREWGVANTGKALAVCEDLVAFVMRYGEGDIHVALSTGPERIALSVTRGEQPSDALPPETGVELLDRVDALARSWGVRESPNGGTTIWAEVAVGT